MCMGSGLCVVGGCNGQCTCCTEHGRYCLSCLNISIACFVLWVYKWTTNAAILRDLHFTCIQNDPKSSFQPWPRFCYGKKYTKYITEKHENKPLLKW